MKKSKFNNNKNNKKLNNKSIWILTCIIFIFLLALVISTKYVGLTDVDDYANVAKFFSGDYPAKIRSSHSFFYGFLLSPLVSLSNSFILIKIMSLVFLSLIVLSLYILSKKDKRALLLSLTAPIFWYMAPWINPVQISSLLFLWAYYYIKEYNKNNKIKNVIYSGILIGLSFVFWDTILFFGFFLIIPFMWDKKVFHLLLLVSFIFIGLIPRFVLDQILFNFFLFTLIKSFFGTLTNLLWNGISGDGGHTVKTFVNLIPIILILPLFTFKLFSRKQFKTNKPTIIFLVLSILLILSNPQIRYTLLIIPIILLNLSPIMSSKEFKIQIIFSILLILAITSTYIIQIQYSTNSPELKYLIKNMGKWEVYTNMDKFIEEDLNNIAKDFPDEYFVVGNNQDYYAKLARIYWGGDIQELVSIEDYKLYLKNETILFEKEFRSMSNIENRREIWIKGGISKSIVDNTPYDKINYAISNESEINLNGFELLKSYKELNVFEKI